MKALEKSYKPTNFLEFIYDFSCGCKKVAEKGFLPPNEAI